MSTSGPLFNQTFFTPTNRLTVSFNQTDEAAAPSSNSIDGGPTVGNQFTGRNTDFLDPDDIQGSVDTFGGSFSNGNLILGTNPDALAILDGSNAFINGINSTNFVTPQNFPTLTSDSLVLPVSDFGVNPDANTILNGTTFFQGLLSSPQQQFNLQNYNPLIWKEPSAANVLFGTNNSINLLLGGQNPFQTPSVPPVFSPFFPISTGMSPFLSSGGFGFNQFPQLGNLGGFGFNSFPQASGFPITPISSNPLLFNGSWTQNLFPNSNGNIHGFLNGIPVGIPVQIANEQENKSPTVALVDFSSNGTFSITPIGTVVNESDEADKKSEIKFVQAFPSLLLLGRPFWMAVQDTEQENNDTTNNTKSIVDENGNPVTLPDNINEGDEFLVLLPNGVNEDLSLEDLRKLQVSASDLLTEVNTSSSDADSSTNESTSDTTTTDTNSGTDNVTVVDDTTLPDVDAVGGDTADNTELTSQLSSLNSGITA